MVEETEARGTPVAELSSRWQLIPLSIGSLVWLWLFARWTYHNSWLDTLFTAVGFPDLIRSERGIRAREPWFPAEPLRNAATELAQIAPDLWGVSTLFDWAVWLLKLAAFATTTEPNLAAGAFITVIMTVLSMFFGLLIAVPVSLARVYGGRVLSRISLVYTELIRGTPLLAQLFFLYFGLPLAPWIDSFGFVGQTETTSTAVIVAVIGFTINSSAYQSEYIRSALQSVDPSQLTAARSIGMEKLQGIRWVVLPQAARYAIPGWTNEFVYLIKYSSLAAFITVSEIFRRGRNIGSDTFQFIDIYIIVGLLYLTLVLTTAVAMQRFEQRVKIPGVGGPTSQN
jgi:polar amino acid transport system permease protein